MGTRLTFTAQTRMLIDERDAANSHFTDAEIYTFINQAIRFLGADLEWPFQTAQATSVANQAVYTLPENFVALTDLYFDNVDLAVLERADLSAISATWQNAPAGQPVCAYQSDTAKIGLYPKPDQERSGKLLQIQYIKLPLDLSTDTDKPDLHLAFQDCIPFYASFLCEHSMGNSKRSETNLGLYEAHKKKLQQKLQSFSDDLLRFRWSEPRMYR